MVSFQFSILTFKISKTLLILVSHSTFSQKCPDGYIGREQFLSVFARYFPFGDSVPFANLLFRHYDSDGEGRILFRRFLQVLSLSARARLEEKIKWAFSFYDQDQDGVLSRADLAIVFDAVHRLVGGVPTTPALLAMKSTNSLSDYYRYVYFKLV